MAPVTRAAFNPTTRRSTAPDAESVSAYREEVKQAKRRKRATKRQNASTSGRRVSAPDLKKRLPSSVAGSQPRKDNGSAPWVRQGNAIGILPVEGSGNVYQLAICLADVYDTKWNSTFPVHILVRDNNCRLSQQKDKITWVPSRWAMDIKIAQVIDDNTKERKLCIIEFGPEDIVDNGVAKAYYLDHKQHRKWLKLAALNRKRATSEGTRTGCGTRVVTS
ncbi:hypothetical protein BC832DRAFT_593856 [Gaertneriomyces semiglobifer]|nr:hypothetical protein BC832DRAFT_593856 [Gaertneriomyces semiglobifer]